MKLLLAAVFAAASALPARAADRENRPLIVALGDSLTSGRGIGAAAAFPAVLQERLDAAGYAYRMVNAGVSGDTTTRALRRYQAALDGRVQILIVALGANDGLRGVPVEQLKANLSAIIEEAQTRGIAVVLVGMDALPLRGWAYSLAFHHAYDELAARFNIPLVPFVLMNVLTNPALMQDDRAHPNQAGARAIANLIWPHLEPLLKKTE
ncbi:MAG: arylesterase [Vicinamibacterales bacterium]